MLLHQMMEINNLENLGVRQEHGVEKNQSSHENTKGIGEIDMMNSNDISMLMQ